MLLIWFFKKIGQFSYSIQFKIKKKINLIRFFDPNRIIWTDDNPSVNFATKREKHSQHIFCDLVGRMLENSW
jgi:hypothetical protein